MNLRKLKRCIDRDVAQAERELKQWRKNHSAETRNGTLVIITDNRNEQQKDIVEYLNNRPNGMP